jgi:hypothetical protein
MSAASKTSLAILITAVLLATAGCKVNPFARRSVFHPAPAPDVSASADVGPKPQAAGFGASLDDIDTRNRADIAAKLGRGVAPGPATPEEVAAMSIAGVDSRFIVCYINRSTGMTPISAQDVIYLHQQGVDEHVIQAMLTPGAADSRLEVARAMPPPTIILADPYWPYYYPYPYPTRYGMSVGYGYGRRCY